MTDQVVEQVESVDEASVLSEEEVRDTVSEMDINPEAYVQKLVEEFNDEKVEELRKIVDDYAVYVDEFTAKIDEHFESTDEITMEDVLPQDPEKEDIRAIKLYQEVGPIYPILKHHNKIPEDIDTKLNNASVKIQNAIQLGVSLYQVTAEEHERAMQQRDMQLAQVVYSMVSFQFINVARTLRKARLENFLSEQLIEEMRLASSDIFTKTREYLSFVDLDTNNLETAYQNIRAIIERYTQFVNHIIGDNNEDQEVDILDEV